MSPSGPNQAAQASAPAATNQNNDTKKQNEKIFHLFLKKLASPNPPVYTEACKKLAQWLNDARAYYPEALTWILKLLLRAQRTLSEQAGVTGKSPFHISLAGSNPFAPEYRDLVNTVAKYRAQFVNTEFLEHLDLFCRSVDDRFAVKSSEPQPSTASQPPRASNVATVAHTPSTTSTIPKPDPSTTKPNPPLNANANAPQETTPTPLVSAPTKSAGRVEAGVGAGEAGTGEGFVRGARLITAKHRPKSPPKAARRDNAAPSAPLATPSAPTAASSTSTSNTHPTLNTTPVPAPAPAPITNPTPTLTSKPATRLSTSTPHSSTPTPNPNNPKTPTPTLTPTPTTLAPKAGGVKLRRRNMPRADILEADDEDARRLLEAAKLPGITVDRRVASKKRGSGSGSGSGRGGSGGGGGRRGSGSGSTASAAKSPSIPIPASATHTGTVAAAGVVNERTPEAARAPDLVKTEVTDERTPALSVSQGPRSRVGSREATNPLQGQVAPPVPLKSEPAPPASVLPDAPSAVPLESRSPHPAPGVEATPANGERHVSQSVPPERVESERAEPAPQVEEPRESTSAPPERVTSESVETVPVPQVEEQPDPIENKVVAAEPEVQASDEPVVSEPLEEPRLTSNTEAEAEAKANDEPAGTVEAPKVTEDEGLKSPLSLSTTESRGSTSTPFAPRFQLSQAVFTSSSSISVSPERGPSIVHENTPRPLDAVVPPTDPASAADAAPSEIPSEILHVSARATPQPQAEPAAAPSEERRLQSVVSVRHASLPMSPRFLEAQMEVVADEPPVSTAPNQIQQPRRSLSASVPAPETASHHGLPMSPRFLESQMDVVGDGDVDAEEGEGAKPVVTTETMSVDSPLQPKNDDLSEEARPPVRSDAPDAHEDPDIAGTVAAPVDPDVPNVTSYVQPVSTDEITNVTNVSESDGAEQALVSSSQEDTGNTEAVKEEVFQQEQLQKDDGAPMEVDLPEAMGGHAGEPVKDDLPEPETQSMDVDVDEGGGEGDASEIIVSPTLEDGEELEADDGTLDAPVIMPAPMEPAVEEKEEGEVRVSPRPVDVPTYSSTILDANNEDKGDKDNVARVTPSDSTSEKALSTPDTAQEVQPEHVDEDQAQDIPEELVIAQRVQDGASTSTSASASFVNANEPSSVSAKEALSKHSHDEQGSSVNETNEAEQASQPSSASTSVTCKLSEQSRDDPGTSVNTNDTDHTSQPPSVASPGGLSEQFRDDQATSANENDHTASTNDDPSAQSPLGSGTSVDGGIPPAAEHDSNVCDDAGLPGRQESPLELNGKKPHIMDVAGQDGKDESGDAVDVRTSAEAPFVSIDGGADASVSGVSYSDKAGLDQSNSIETDLHQVNNNVPSDVLLNGTDNPNFNSTPNPMDTANDAPTQAVNVPISDSVPVSDDHVVQPMFRPGVTILGILTANEENAKATSRFVLQDEIETLLAQWRSRYKTQVDMTNAASVSLACYRSGDMAETLSVVGTSPDAASEFVNSCPQTWPTDGSLSVGMFYDGKRQFIPLAPPLLPTHDRFLDVSQFVHEGDNTFEIEFEPPAKIYTCILFAHHPTQTQLADVAMRRKNKVLWAQQLSSCFRPLEIPTFVF